MKDEIDFHDLRALIGTMIAGSTQDALAKRLGISPAYLSDVIRGRKEPGRKILEPLGFERKVVYVRKTPVGE